MLKSLKNLIKVSQTEQQLSTRMARAAASSAVCRSTPNNPLSWQFSGFSQNSEDGITSYLISRLTKQNRYFVEIGASNGLENNTAWLAFGLKYCGLMVEGNAEAMQFCRDYLQRYNWGVTYFPCFVSIENIKQIFDLAIFKDPDVFSIDIDGNDYYIARALLELGFRPKIIIAEYNAVFGSEQSVTIPYQADFDRREAHNSALYYGVSIRAWQSLLKKFGYQFITVESNGVNAFFVDSDCFDQEFLKAINGLGFAENYAERRMRGKSWEKWFEEINHLKLCECE